MWWLFFSTAWAIKLKELVVFENSCILGERFTVAAVGDILLHGRLQKRAFSQKEHAVLWSELIYRIEESDIAYANLEGPVAEGVARGGKIRKDPGPVFDDFIYSSFPQFNYHHSLIGSLLRSGFNVVSTSNNHSVDRASIGVDKTIDVLERHKMPFTGTRKKGETEQTRPWYTIVKQGNLTLTFLACTFSTNGLSDPYHQVLMCHDPEDQARMMSLIKAQAQKTDAVIVTPHWGEEYQTYPLRGDEKLGRAFLEAGALAVIGNHPHVVQPMERIVTRDGRETFIIYSIGNFVSGQGGVPKRTSLILYLGITKNSKGTFLNGVRYTPTYMQSRPMHLWEPPVMHASRKHLRSILHPDYLLEPHEELITNPKCTQLNKKYTTLTPRKRYRCSAQQKGKGQRGCTVSRRDPPKPFR